MAVLFSPLIKKNNGIMNDLNILVKIAFYVYSFRPFD